MDFEQYTFFDGTPPHVRQSETSLEAAQSIKKDVGKLHRLVLYVVAEAEPHGLTREEIEHATGLCHQTGSARVRELFLSGHLRTRLDPSTGKTVRRKTTSGRSAEVCYLNHETSI